MIRAYKAKQKSFEYLNKVLEKEFEKIKCQIDKDTDNGYLQSFLTFSNYDKDTFRYFRHVADILYNLGYNVEHSYQGETINYTVSWEKATND